VYTYTREILFASFEGRGRKGLGGEENEERRESLSLV